MKKILIIACTLFLLLPVGQAQNKRNKGSLETVDGKMSSPAKGSVPVITVLPPPQQGLDAPLHVALEQRRTSRQFSEESLSPELLSGLMWSAYGYNRPNEHKRVAPSARNCQEYDIYLFTEQGGYRYDADKHSLTLVVDGDNRAVLSSQKFFATAPAIVLLVANYDRMKMFSTPADRDFYAAVDGGYISQNIYLFCAAAELGTVACGAIDRDAIHKLLNITNGRAMLAHPVGKH